MLRRLSDAVRKNVSRLGRVLLPVSKPMPLQVDILTIFPELVEPYLHAAMLGRGEKAGALKLKAHQLRQWAYDRHQKVDDRPFGGGPGMVMKVEPFYEGLKALGIFTKQGTRTKKAAKSRVILLSAKGKRFVQKEARRLSEYDHLVFLCGRYEGVDERVAENLIDEELSVGDFVLTGGELGALIVTDAVARLRAGVLGDETSAEDESHSEEGVLEYPQYTRPDVFEATKKLKWSVPEILLSGDHAKMKKWREGMKKRL